MAERKIETVREQIYWSYANLAMAHTAVDKKQEKYERFNYIIRAKLFKGLNDGTMNMRSIFDDEKIKLQVGQVCNYCGSPKNLTLDHVFPQRFGGTDNAENLIYACKSCNSSKGKKDLMEWMAFRGEFLPLMIIRRYLKLTFNFCNQHGLLDKKMEELVDMELPFRIDLLPIKFPNPNELVLNITDKKERFKIANWNLERPKQNSKKTKPALEKIKEINADIIVLTETSNAVDLSSYYPYKVSTEAFERTPDEQWVTIWSKWKIIKQIPTFDNNRTVSCIIETPFGETIFYGTIIPYHQAGVSGVRYGNLNYKPWEYHEKDLYKQSENWSELLNKEKIPLFVIGDFNQSRYNNQGYGTKKVRQILTDLLSNLDLRCVTEIDFSKEYLSPDPKKGKTRNNIDHICISEILLNKMKEYKVGAWNHFTEQGIYMSDHNGVYIEFEI